MIYAIGIVFVILVILISVDDLIWDIYYFIKQVTKKTKRKAIPVADIEAVPPKMLALIVAAYNEENVLQSVIRNIVLSNQYPQSMLHIFLGVYPNDLATLAVAEELEAEFENVHRVIHVLNGPSSKADNLNNVIHHIYDFEERNHVRFAGVIVHDSEDLVHPYEFKLENYLLESHNAIQMPVFPLQEMPKISNLFKNMVSGTYADEFAENHYRMLVARSETNAFVPSAGTGFVLSRHVLDQFEDHNIFPVGSLTEDYKLSLLLKQMGYDVHYALEHVERLKNDGSVVKEFISTRSMFPATYKAAVKQKTRWIYGITIQTFKFNEIFKSNTLNIQSQYSLYKDWKAKFGNLLLGPGYLIFTYFLLSLFIELPVLYPKFTPSWYLMVVLSILMVERQVLRFIAVKKVYGYKSAFISSLFPPLLPFRMVFGNLINFHSTINAWLMYFKKPSKKKTKKTPVWSKTDHEFLKEEILLRFRRNLGDTLLYKGLLTSKQLKEALHLSKNNNKKLGTTLIELNFVSENDVVQAVCEIRQALYIDLQPGSLMDVFDYGKDTLASISAIPIFKPFNQMVVLTTLEADKEMIKKTLKVDNIYFTYASSTSVMAMINSMNNDDQIHKNIIHVEENIKSGLISIEQGLLALKYNCCHDPIIHTLQLMGLAIEKNKYYTSNDEKNVSASSNLWEAKLELNESCC